jgi:NADH-quinone oxidoreductase subunit G
MPAAGFRFFNEKIARQTSRFSGRTAMDANISVDEPKPPQDNCSPLAYSMEAYEGYPPSDLISYYWSPGWNSVQAMNKYMEEPNGPLKNGGDPGILLFGSGNTEIGDYYEKISHQTKLKADELLVIPVWQIFGSEELSSQGEAISKRTSQPFILINETEIRRFRLSKNELCQLLVNKISINVTVKNDNAVPDGIIGLSFAIPGVPYINLPCPGKLNKVVTSVRRKEI